MNSEKVKILMCGSALTNGGGVVAVTKNLLDFPGWGKYEIIYVPTHIDGTCLAKIVFFFRAFRKITYLVKFHNISIAHLHMCDGGPLYRKGIILRYLKSRDIKVVLHHHTDYTEFFDKLRGIKRSFAKKTLDLCDVNIVLGKGLINCITNLEPNAKVTVVYNGVVPQPERKYNVHGHYILFMGWLLERKGIIDLVRAIKMADDILDDRYKVAICGIGDRTILERIKEIDVNNRIEFMGWIDDEKKKSLFDEVIINVLPSYREAAPMSIMETMAYGIPNIASSISAIPEIIDNGKTGILINAHNPTELSREIVRLVNDSDLREFLSFNSYCTIEDSFSLNQQVNSIISIYDKICSELR